MSAATLRLVLLVSCAHAMVHVYELSFPCVEELVANAYDVDKQTTGALSNCWRFPWGLGALLAGWLVDRYGAKWLLVIYLLGCAATAGLMSIQPTLAILFVTMFAMGSFASIYHPAGLALISHETQPEHRPMALGYHGILGSLGIAAGPFLGGLVLAFSTWTGYYQFLIVPGVVLAAVIAVCLTEHHRAQPSVSSTTNVASADTRANWRAFCILIVSGMLSGFIYAALMSFLPRYLRDLSFRPEGIPDRSFKNYVAGVVLLVGVVGQYLAGRMGRAGSLERQMPLILLALAPMLLGMAVAQGTWRIVAACGVSLVMFMNQPIYNALIAQYVPRARRSLGFGISNALGFGIGSFGALFAGAFQSDLINFSGLAGVAALSGLIALALPRPASGGPCERGALAP
jgi:FSR family fosmidomycin resistance protein-like MFS transporter